MQSKKKKNYLFFLFFFYYIISFRSISSPWGLKDPLFTNYLFEWIELLVNDENYKKEEKMSKIITKKLKIVPIYFFIIISLLPLSF